MKIVYTADLHGIENLYSQLFRLAVNWGANTIIIGGDLLPKHGSFWTSVKDQRGFIIRFMRPTRNIRVCTIDKHNVFPLTM